MEPGKKKRGENWSTEEKEILRTLIAQSAKILEDKSTKTNINNLKVKEWKKLTNTLNEITGKNRSDSEIKLAWKRMKLAAKANLSLHRKEQSLTGGGTKPPSPSPEDLQVMEIAPHDFVIEVNDFDSDAMIQNVIIKEPEPIPGPSSQVQPGLITLLNDETLVPKVQENKMMISNNELQEKKSVDDTQKVQVKCMPKITGKTPLN